MSIDEYAGRLTRYDGPPLRLMEVCGTHTHSIFSYGIREILPDSIKLISGPGCPVCVTPTDYIDFCVRKSLEENSVLCTFGDMVRVPGRESSLSKAGASGGSVRIMYAPVDVADWARQEPEKTFYVAAVGFETTLPTYALLLQKAAGLKLRNIRLITSLKALMPALDWIAAYSPHITGYIGPGHVSAVIGAAAYVEFCAKYRVPLAVAGFGYEQIIAAIWDLARQHQRGTCEVHNLYPGAVAKQGNREAADLINRFFIRKASLWRGLGTIDESGYFLAPEYGEYDAGYHPDEKVYEPEGCLCGQVVIGKSEPRDCPMFGTACTPFDPVGPCMVSSEGACGIWYRNRSRADR